MAKILAARAGWGEHRLSWIMGGTAIFQTLLIHSLVLAACYIDSQGNKGVCNLTSHCGCASCLLVATGIGQGTPNLFQFSTHTHTLQTQGKQMDHLGRRF